MVTEKECFKCKNVKDSNNFKFDGTLNNNSWKNE
jgi:hypothetical protein